MDPTGYWCISIIGLTIQGGAINGFFISFWLVHDNHGNHGILITVGIGFCTPQVSITWSPFFSWRKTIYKLKGVSHVIGGGVDVGASIGVDCIIDSKGPAAIQLNIGGGLSPISFDVHGYGCATYLIPIKDKNYKKIHSVIKKGVFCMFKLRRKYR